MRLGFLASDKPREQILAQAFVEGVRRHGIETFIVRLAGEETFAAGADVVVMCGVKSRLLWAAHRKAGIRCIYLDKGYARHKAPGRASWEFWRVAVDDHHPTRHLERMSCPGDRWEALGLEMRPWRKAGSHIVLAGSSEKYHLFYGLSRPTEYAAKVAARLADFSRREIVYRPKPSWAGRSPIAGTRYSEQPETIDDVLAGAHALVTHGSNACFEAMVRGVPCVTLGNAVALPISSTEIEAIEAPRLAPDEARLQLLRNLAYCQWTLQEFASGEAFDLIKGQMLYA